MESEQHRREIDWSKFMEWSLTIVGKELQFAQLGIDYRGTIKTFLVRGGWFLFEFNKMAVSLPHKPDAWELLPSDRIPAIRGETRTKKLSFITERKRQGIIIEEIYDTDRTPPFYILFKGIDPLDYEALPLSKPS